MQTQINNQLHWLFSLGLAMPCWHGKYIKRSTIDEEDVYVKEEKFLRIEKSQSIDLMQRLKEIIVLHKTYKSVYHEIKDDPAFARSDGKRYTYNAIKYHIRRTIQFYDIKLIDKNLIKNQVINLINKGWKRRYIIQEVGCNPKYFDKIRRKYLQNRSAA